MTQPDPMNPLPGTPLGSAPDDPPLLSVPMAVAFYGALLLVAAVWAALTEPGLALLTRAPAERALPWWLAGPGTGLALVAVTALLEPRSPSLRRLAAELAVLVAPVTWPRVLALALLSGICEEALFRGPVQHAFGYAVASVLFALLHGGLSVRYLPWSTFALLAGLCFGLLAGAYESVWPAAVAHVVVNAVNLRRLGRLPDPDPGEQDAGA